VRAGDTIPVDGRVRAGESSVREDSFSGESLPRTVGPGDGVSAGTVNRDATLTIEASGSYAQSRLALLQRSIDRARLEKPAVARLADRLASRFIAAILLATLGTGLVWWTIEPTRALWVALSVLVISCPCALSLATPASLANAAARLRRLGIIVYGENALESMAGTSHALFDKTGTLTTAAFRIEEIHTLDPAVDEDLCIALAAALQAHANHPIATAFQAQGSHPSLDRVSYRVGAGVAGERHGKQLRIGSVTFCREIAPGLPDPPATPCHWVALVSDGEPMAWFGLVDEPRPEAASVIATLRESGLRCGLVTGDTSLRGRQMAEKFAFDDLRTGMSPQDKLDYVVALQRRGARVTMIGDGLNDAPVLTQANSSIAVAGASDLARAQADFVIERGDLRKVLDIFATARRTRRVILQNFAWALGYNAIGVPLAALGLVPPWAAALGMSASSLLVIANASRLRHR
jgi:Cu2+-exporting ATPase